MCSEGRRIVFKLAGLIRDPKQNKNVKAGFFKRNGEDDTQDKSDDWTNFIYRKLFFYRDYYQMLDTEDTGEITKAQITGFNSKQSRPGI